MRVIWGIFWVTEDGDRDRATDYYLMLAFTIYLDVAAVVAEARPELPMLATIALLACAMESIV